MVQRVQEPRASQRSHRRIQQDLCLDPLDTSFRRISCVRGISTASGLAHRRPLVPITTLGPETHKLVDGRGWRQRYHPATWARLARPAPHRSRLEPYSTGGKPRVGQGTARPREHLDDRRPLQQARRVRRRSFAEAVGASIFNPEAQPTIRSAKWQRSLKHTPQPP